MLNKIKKILGLTSPCPYCGVVLDPPPQRKKKCKGCGNVIYVKKQNGGRKHLLTEKEVKRLEREDRDKRWKELSKQVQAAMHSADWQSLSQAYLSQARILFSEGKNHHTVAREAKKCDLRRMLEIGIEKIKISTCRDERVCPGCHSLDGKVFSVQDALEQMPIPGRHCEGGWCRCLYIAVGLDGP